MISKLVSRVIAVLAALGFVGSMAPPTRVETSTKSVQPPAQAPSKVILQACSDGWPPYCSPAPPIPPHPQVRSRVDSHHG